MAATSAEVAASMARIAALQAALQNPQAEDSEDEEAEMARQFAEQERQWASQQEEEKQNTDNRETKQEEKKENPHEAPAIPNYPAPFMPGVPLTSWGAPEVSLWLRWMEEKLRKQLEIFQAKGWAEEEISAWLEDLRLSFNSSDGWQAVDGPALALLTVEEIHRLLGPKGKYHALSLISNRNKRIKENEK